MTATTKLAAALDILGSIDRSELTEGQAKLLDASEIGLTLLEQETGDGERDLELAEHARLAFGIN